MSSMIAIISGTQHMMNSYLEEHLQVDGIIGPITQLAYENAPFECLVIFEEMGIPLSLIRYLEEENIMSSQGKKVSRRDAARIAKAFYRVSRDMDVPTNWLMSFARIESSFDMNATNGSSRGLFQFQPAAWQDASKHVALRDYDRYWNDPYENAKAAAAYMKINISQLAKRGLDARSEPRWLYLAHQQGVGGLTEMISLSRGGRDNGIITREKMRRNKPPGYDPTTSPVKFYHNWMSYLSKYFK